MSNTLKRPTVRFTASQYELIQARLIQRGLTFQQYCSELICNDLGIDVKKFQDEIDGQMTIEEMLQNSLPL